MKRMQFEPDDDDSFFARRDELTADFETWLADLPVDVDPGDFELLLDWKWGYGGGRLDHWQRADLREFLLDWCPRKLAATADAVHGLPSTVVLSMSFLAERGLIAAGSDPVEMLTEYAAGLQTDFMEQMADPANFGLGKSIFGHLDIDDPMSLNPAELQSVMDAFNDLPEDERRAVTDAAIGAGAGQMAPTGTGQMAPTPAGQMAPVGPVRMPAGDEARASADTAPVLDGFAKLADYFAAPGKPLTAKGNLKLADARALVEILGTGDVYEEVVGEHVYRKNSSTRFVELDHWQWWARTTGVLRQRGNKLVAVKAWQDRRRTDPVSELQKVFDVLLDYGALRSYWTGWRGGTDDLIDESIPALLGHLLRASGSLEYDGLLESWTAMAATLGEAEYYPGEINRSFNQMCTLLERAGVISQDGIVLTPARHRGTDRSGGTLQLTPIGVELAVGLLEDEGQDVTVLPDLDELTAAGLVALAEDALDPPAWWDMAIPWLDLQADATDGVRALLAELAAPGLALLIIGLEAMPESEYDRFAPILRELYRTDPPPAELGSAALDWLLKHELLKPEELASEDIDGDVVMDCILVVSGAMAEAGADLGLDQDQGDSRDDLMGIISAAGQRMPPGAIPLLEAIAREAPDKKVSKAARKELFRVRSKLAQAGRH